MTKRLRVVVAASVVALVAAAAAAAMPNELEVTPVARMPFPDRAYVVSVPGGAILDRSSIGVRENGRPVTKVRVTPLSASGIRVATVLAVDSSRSMRGAPYAAALRAAETFVREAQPGTQVGLVSFNGQVEVVMRPTSDRQALLETLARPPALGVGTRIYDALAQSLRLLRAARTSAGTIVLLSDGDDVGSVRGLDELVATAKRDRVRIFTVGLRSETHDATALRAIADATGAAYAEAGSAEELNAIYAGLGNRLASDYVVRYRSAARPESHVDVRIEIAGRGLAAADYTAPTPARLDPYQRSFLTRFVLSPASVALIALAFASLFAMLLVMFARGPRGRRPRATLVHRIAEFSAPAAPRFLPQDSAAARKARAGARYTQGRWAAFQRDLELARIEMSPRRIAAITLGSAVVLVVLLGTVSMLLAILALVAPPLVARSTVRWKLRKTRDEFADQLPTSLQVLASALRAGHSFTGALGVVVDNAAEPARSELQRVVRDEQLGVAPEVALRRVGARMANRDLDQVALLAEMQRTSGGNAAEILDTIVETIRQRGELRRLVRSLTAQGRMARWILTALPLVLTLFLWFMQPELMSAFFASTGGQMATFVAIALVAAGSTLIQRIIDIDV